MQHLYLRIKVAPSDLPTHKSSSQIRDENDERHEKYERINFINESTTLTYN